MKRGTFYAKRVKRLFNKLKQEHGPPDIPEPTAPLHQLLLALLSADVSDHKGTRAMKALFDVMVDLNEIRVSTNAEIARAIGAHLPDATKRAETIRRALDAVFRKEHAICLDRLQKLGRREARQYLLDLSGVDSAAAASVVLWSLGGHAIPVDERVFEALRKADMVDPSASIDQVQAFLERNISANDAKAFCLLMNKFAASRAPSPGKAPEDGKAGRTRGTGKSKRSSDGSGRTKTSPPKSGSKLTKR